jgi:iron-sulfur cluster repair protein YtfE (RIC family)
MDAKAVRVQIVGEHEALKELLAEVEALARKFEQLAEGDAAIGRQLHTLGLTLYEKFGMHLENEQGLLEPVLRAAGHSGERLADRLVREHREQRELLKYLVGRIEKHPVPTILVARELQNFAGFLRVEMAHEEETMLSDQVLGSGGV